MLYRYIKLFQLGNLVCLEASDPPKNLDQPQNGVSPLQVGV